MRVVCVVLPAKKIYGFLILRSSVHDAGFGATRRQQGASSILAEIMSIIFHIYIFFTFVFGYIFLCDVSSPHTTGDEEPMSSAERVAQPTGNNAAHACRPQTEPEAT